MILSVGTSALGRAWRSSTAGRQALQLRHADIVGIEHLDQVVAQHAHRIDRHDDGERQRRQGHGQQVFAGAEVSSTRDMAGRSGTTMTKRMSSIVPSRKSGIDSSTSVIDREAVVDGPVAAHRLDHGRDRRVKRDDRG